MAYPTGSNVTAGTNRKRLFEARKALQFLESIGFAKRTPFGTIMPGAQWAGWGDKEIVILAASS